jgi:tRNA threonylcarbamoyladenosine biosynthesis protein TsaE
MTNNDPPASEAVSLHLPDPDATADLARRVAAIARPGDVIALTGDLGAGKSTFARAFIHALPQPDGSYVEEHVPSPTFTLVQTYDRRPASVWHFDLYRLGEPSEVTELGWDEARDGGILLVEWPDRLGPLAPRERLDVTLILPPNEPDPEAAGRTAVIQGGGAWAERVTELAHDA